MSNYEVFRRGEGDKAVGAPVYSFTKGVEVESEALEQVLNLAQMPFLHHHVALMPDVHAGCGSTIGSVIATKGAIIPAAVGVDIGCGMIAVKTELTANQLPDNLTKVRAAIESAVPHGRTDNGGPNDRGAWHDVPAEICDVWNTTLAYGFRRITNNHHKIGERVNCFNHLGTLGTGNHFIEVCVDENDSVWIMLHSGSRGIGNRIGSYFIELAKQDMQKYFINLPDKDLAYIPEGAQHFDEYLQAISWAQDYARLNRMIMLNATTQALTEALGLPSRIAFIETAINCHHNYVEKEHHYGANVLVTRKGAVRARSGDLGIIPGNMGVGSYIVRGLGNPESFHSCSHGAGRRMSRGRAKALISLADHIRDTQGVECRKDEDVLDESPQAYKNLDAVMKAQDSLVEIVHKLKPLVCVKG